MGERIAKASKVPLYIPTGKKFGQKANVLLVGHLLHLLLHREVAKIHDKNREYKPC